MCRMNRHRHAYPHNSGSHPKVIFMETIHPADEFELLRCPACGGGFLQREGSEAILACAGCGWRYPLKYGLPDFSHDAEFYWGELDRDVMAGLLNPGQSVEVFIKSSLRKTNPALADYLEHYVFDRRRAGWKYLLNLPSDGRVLDFGCGWGALALSLACHFRDVWVSDAVPERVAMVLKRAREIGYNHVQGCCASGWPRLPFPDDCFDLVVLNGVLEWIPASLDGDPCDIQQAFLREASRVLRPSGQFVVGIENRLGISYFMGRREEHTKLKYVSLLPRPLGRIYHRLVKKNTYRAYTHGRYGLRRMLRSAGMVASRFLCPYPDYREFDRVFDPAEKLQVEAAFDPHSRRGRMAAFIDKHILGMRWWVNSFLVIAEMTEQPAYKGFWLRLLVQHGALSGGDASVILRGYRLTSNAGVMIRLQLPGTSQETLLTLPLDEAAAGRLERAIAIRQQIVGAFPINLILPMTHGRFEGIPYVIETWFPGRKASDLPTAQGERKAWETLSRLQQTLPSQRQAFCPAMYFSETTLRAFLLACGWVGAPAGWMAMLWREHATLVGPIHGDFHAGNVLVRVDGADTCVIDWDLAAVTGLPLWDALNLWVHARYESAPDWASAFREAYMAICDRQAKSRLNAYRVEHGLQSADIRIACLTFPLLQWRNKMQSGDRRGEVITAKLLPVLEFIASDENLNPES